MRFRPPPLVDPRCVVTGPPLKTAFIMFQRDPHACKQWQNQLEEKKRDSTIVYSWRVDVLQAGWLQPEYISTALNYLNSIFSSKRINLARGKDTYNWPSGNLVFCFYRVPRCFRFFFNENWSKMPNWRFLGIFRSKSGNTVKICQPFSVWRKFGIFGTKINRF